MQWLGSTVPQSRHSLLATLLPSASRLAPPNTWHAPHACSSAHGWLMAAHLHHRLLQATADLPCRRHHRPAGRPRWNCCHRRRRHPLRLPQAGPETAAAAWAWVRLRGWAGLQLLPQLPWAEAAAWAAPWQGRQLAPEPSAVPAPPLPCACCLPACQAMGPSPWARCALVVEGAAAASALPPLARDG